MMKNSQYGRPRIGTVRFRNGTVFVIVIDCVCGVIEPAVGVTTTEYAPSCTSGTTISPTNSPSVPELRRFVAMTAGGGPPSNRTWEPGDPFVVVEVLTYPAHTDRRP